MTLVASNVSLTLGRQRVLDGISFTHEAGRVVALLGPNGAGKSSLLRIMSGEWRAGSGQVTLNGVDVQRWPMRDLASVRAVVPQLSTLDFPFTAAEVVMLGRIPHASGRRNDEAITSAALERVDAGHLAARLYTELSGGEKQRIHLARALAQVWEPSAHGPRYLLLDEPGAAFDLANQQMLIELIHSFADSGVAVLVVMHDLNLAARAAHTMILLKAGRVAASGSPHEVMQPATIRAVFGVEANIGFHPGSGTPLAIL